MLNCTDTVYILLLHSGLHLLHAPFGPKITFYGLLLALETKKKNMSTVDNNSGCFGFRETGKTHDSLSVYYVEELSLHKGGRFNLEFQITYLVCFFSLQPFI